MDMKNKKMLSFFSVNESFNILFVAYYVLRKKVVHIKNIFFTSKFILLYFITSTKYIFIHINAFIGFTGTLK